MIRNSGRLSTINRSKYALIHGQHQTPTRWEEVSEEGTAPGGGVAFVRPINAIHKLKLQDDEPVGMTIECCVLEGRGGEQHGRWG